MTDSTPAQLTQRLDKIEQLFGDRHETMKDLVSHSGRLIGKLEAQTKATSDVLETLTTGQEKQHSRIIDSNSQARAYVDTQIEQTLALVRSSMVPAKPDSSEIYKALAMAQLEINNASANVDNEFTGKRYANLASVMDAVRGPLANQGIAIFQQTYDPGEPGVIGIKTVLAHGESGQTLEDILTMVPPKDDPQGIGSCRTYLRRYSLMAMTAIAGAFDDDAESTKKDADKIKPEEADEILALADKLFKSKADDVVNRMLSTAFPGAVAVADIPADLYQSAINLLNNQSKREKAQAKPKPRPKKPPTTESKPEPGSDG
jgi:hypothetical protein